MEVRIVRLEPMRVAYVNAFGATPEADAWKVLLGWAKGKGLLDGGRSYHLFGYDNPPRGEKGLHGYDTWITVGTDVQCRPEERVQAKEFAGGLYAVTRCSVADVVDTWMKLHEWVTNSRYQMDNRQWLEEHLTLPQAPWQDVLLDLYYPLAE
jgi:DNA gyrase inhibitor GyrI